MRRLQRRVFAAPFIVSIVVAAPACKPGGADGKGPEEPKKPPTEEVDPTTAAAEPYNQWMVVANDDGQCSARYQDDCPEGAHCNPPRPATVACPAGVTGDVEMRLLQLEENGPCYVEAADCTADCDRQPAECPTWD